jgi:hypothetical protein
MNCEQAKQLMNAFVDNELNDQELNKLNAHLDSCESCTVEFEELKYMVLLMGEIELKELPKGYEEELHEKLLLASSEMKELDLLDHIINETNDNASHKENHGPMSGIVRSLKNFKFNKKFYTYAAIPAVLIIMVFATKDFWSLSKNESAVSDEYYVMETTAAALEMDQARGEESGGFVAGSAPEVSFNESMTLKSNAVTTTAQTPDGENPAEEVYRDGRMIIQSASIQMDIEKYDDVMSRLKTFVADANGYIENESTSFKYYISDTDQLKYGYVTLRIPAEGYNSILEQIKNLGLVTNDSSNATDVTKAYRDTASEIENLKITESRLREIMAQAVEISDILSIENELTRIRGNINSYEKQIKNWESLVDLTTITVTLNEVKNLKPVVEPLDESLWGKAKEGFIGTINAITHFVEQLFIWLIAKSPYLVGLAIIAIFTKLIYNKRRKIHEK